MRFAPVGCAVGIWLSLLVKSSQSAFWPAPLLAIIAALGLAQILNGLELRRGGWRPIWLVLPVLWIGVWESFQPEEPSVRQPFWPDQIGQSLRASVHDAVAGITPAAKGLVLGITDGDTSLLSDSLQSQFKQLNLTHLTAVSGTNCAILIGALVITAAQLGLKRRGRLALAILGILGYLLLVGGQPSVVRAAIMSVLVLLGLGLGLRLNAIHLVSFAVVAALCLFPSFATNLGFQLSVAATTGVLFVAPRVARRLEACLPKVLALALAVAVSAQITCLPLLISLQTNPSAGSLVANILAEPTVAPATLLGLLGAAFALAHWAPLQWLAQGLFLLASFPAAFIVALSHWILLSFPKFPLPGGVEGELWSLGVLLAVLLFLSEKDWMRHTSGILALMVILVLTFQMFPRLPSGYFAPTGWVLVACDVGQGDATVLSAGGQIAVVDAGRDDLPIDKCLRRLKIRRVNLLVLTHFDLDHVGGLAGVLRHRRVDSVLLTDYEDTRPGASEVETLLENRRIPCLRVSRGDHGILGTAGSANAMSWLVLTPHHNGADSINSNDGSIAMFWHSSQASIFTMADLPASGQVRIMQERGMWWDEKFRKQPMILKVSHHGSADQDPEFLAWLRPLISTISVGVGNPYGHPTDKTLNWLRQVSARTLRTDQLGSVSITPKGDGGLVWANTGAG